MELPMAVIGRCHRFVERIELGRGKCLLLPPENSGFLHSNSVHLFRSEICFRLRQKSFFVFSFSRIPLGSYTTPSPSLHSVVNEQDAW